MKLIIAYLMCTISQGPKGTYETSLLAMGYDAKFFYTSAHGPRREQPGTARDVQYTKIPRNQCRVVAVLSHKKEDK